MTSSNFRWLLAAVIFGISAPLPAAPVYVRLIDAERKLPLEYWQHTDEQPAVGHALHFRMPTAVLIDGKAAPFAKLEKSAKVPGKNIAEDEDLAQELGLEGPAEKPARSDRAGEIEGSGGVKAQLAVELKDGEHTVVPGAATFTLRRGEVAVADNSGYTKTGPTAMSLACYPVDFNLCTGSSFELKLNVRVKQGEHEVFYEQFSVRQALALRLFLPASKVPYVVALGKTIQAAITVSPDGVKLAGAATVPTGATVETERFTLGIALPSTAKDSAATAPGAKSPGAKPELYLFTDRNRSAYAEGEKVEISVRAFGPLSEKATVSLTLKQGDQNLPLPAAALARCDTNGRLGAAELALDTTLLRPGDYELSAVWTTASGAKITSNMHPLSITSLLPATNLKLFGYSKWGSSSFDPKDLAAAIRAGLNLVMQGGAGAQGGHVIAGATLTFLYPYEAHTRSVAVPLRMPKGGKAKITFAAAGGVSLQGTSLKRLKLGSLNNLALADLQKPSANPQAPAIQVPNIHGFLGDPRVEQTARGFPEKGEFALPPDVKETKTDAFSYFDGNIRTGTPLYPTSRPGFATWDPPSALPTLRSAQVIMDFARPIAVHGLGVWEHPHDRPVSAFALEMKVEGPAAANADPSEEKGERWKLVLYGTGNLDYYHLHRLAQPATAKTWRYTILDTPSVIQRIAEIELYSSSLDSLLDGDGLEK